MPRFFVNQPVLHHARFELEAEAAQHVRVLRLREGESIVLFDGHGGETPATIAAIGKRAIEVETLTHDDVERESPRAVTLYAALIANDRMDWMIQKATELGVAAVQPLFSERSQRIPGDVAKRVDHWRGVAIAACEQCGRNRVPALHAPIALARAIEVTSAQREHSVLLDAEATSGPPAQGHAMNVFVGPEGGFAAAERDALIAHCAHRLRIGHTVLRAETAAVAALAALALL